MSTEVIHLPLLFCDCTDTLTSHTNVRLWLVIDSTNRIFRIARLRDDPLDLILDPSPLCENLFRVACSKHLGLRRQPIDSLLLTVMTDMGTLGGDNSDAIWINERGDVTGSADLPGFNLHDAVVWKDGKMIDLGRLVPTEILSVPAITNLSESF